MTKFIKYGGTLQEGDFIGVGANHGMTFGWYSGNGRSGTLQFIRSRTVVWEFDHFNERKAKGDMLCNKDKRGFSLDHIGKEYVKNSKTNCVVKINDATGLFTDEELDRYEKAVVILKAMNFLK